MHWFEKLSLQNTFRLLLFSSLLKYLEGRDVGRKDINDEEKINKRDVWGNKQKSQSYRTPLQYRCFYIVKGMLLKGKVTAFRV